ncbi:hypothetical protein [Paenibacillus qinlingensis]|uniref:hypothetical protein n=1 Tax=Paenibacillus qinlingensis TaxID=1837343 RepID=UPI00156423D2|nr:hypothetical protein [Paenibacillus qinlingensis]NQX60408.1 hypothetical protein [Paenibacillus qinlingensis]
MINFEKVFCVECNEMMDKCYARKIFKTGYYHTTIPLAHCMKCETMHAIYIPSYVEGMAVASWI